MTQQRHPIYWEGELVGWMLDFHIDHFKFYGTWKSANTPKSELFLKMLNIEDELLWVKVGNMDNWSTVEFPPDPTIEFTLRIGLTPD